MSAKQIITSFFKLDFVKDSNVLDFFHQDCEIHWSNSKGYILHNKTNLEHLLSEIKKSYLSYQAQPFQILEDGNFVTVRFTVYLTTIEQPDKEQAMADFIAIYELIDDKIYRCHQISNLTDANTVERIENE